MFHNLKRSGLANRGKCLEKNPHYVVSQMEGQFRINYNRSKHQGIQRKTMKTSFVCILSGLVFYSDFIKSQEECSGCCCAENRNLCLQNIAECQACLDGYWGGKCNNKCPSNCLVCLKEPVRSPPKTGSILYHVCTKCKDGYYLGDTDNTRTCDLACPSGCSNCTSSINCDKCKPGYYNDGNNMCVICKNTCTACSSDSLCTTCKNGYYGLSCDRRCSVGCSGNVCDIENGTCRCGTRFSGETCEQCAVGYYGENCDQTCTSTCMNGCNQITGYCFSCVSSNYTGNFCESCINGTYGTACEQSCSKNCKGKVCDSITGNCINCNDNFDGSKCDLCVPGKYGDDCISDCPDNCKDKNCTKVEGDCVECPDNFTGKICDQCQPGFYSKDCNVHCPSPNCFTCSRMSGTCELCKHVNYGEFCNQNCSIGCKYGNCTKELGECIDGCSEQYSGDKCCVRNQKCLECISETKCATCDHGFFGTDCEMNCNSACKDGCLNPDGECIGCKENTYGPFCNANCSVNCSPNGNFTSCDEDDGKCLKGCEEGFFGVTCVKACISPCVDNTCEQEQGTCLKQGPIDPPSIVGPAAGGAAGGVAVVAAVVVIAAVFYKRRRSASKPSYSDEGYANANTFDASFRNSGTGESEMKAPSSTSRKSNKQKPKSKYKSEELEDPAEEFIDEEDEVADYANASDKDAYYNVTLKVKVSELYGYVTRKSIEQYKTEFKLLPKELSKPHTYARKPENIKKNRYAGIYPYDETRVTVTGDPCFFINANYIRGYKKEKGYIASLGPTKVATEDFQTFWKMVWHEKSDVIVMLTNLQELSGMKCERYWPNLERPESYGNITVTCQSEDVLAEYTVRTFTISQKKETRTLTQFHFTAWPDKGVPDHVVSLVEFWQRVKSYTRGTGGPDIVHCSAGIGRTGTFIAIDRLTQEGKAEGSVNVYGCILDMREQRVSMVQTQEQFIYLHQALVNTLVLECEAVRAETFHQHVNSLTSATFAHYFQLLQKTVEDEHDDEKDARARNATNKAVNREGADVPGDLNRPRLHFNKSFNDPDYTNATFINGLKRKNAFIVAQTPLPASLEDFVTLLYQEECPCIVSLEDEPFNRKDVGVYLPADNQSLTVGHFTLTSTRCESKRKYLMRKLTIQYADKAKEKKTMHHFQYTGWQKDKHTPEDPQQFLQFINDVKWKAATGNAVQDNKAILVHCLNAYSRSGLFCTVAVLTEKLQAENQVSIPNTIRQIRTRRNGAITDKDQLEFCYRCATVYLDQFATYTNFAS